MGTSWGSAKKWLTWPASERTVHIPHGTSAFQADNIDSASATSVEPEGLGPTDRSEALATRPDLGPTGPVGHQLGRETTEGLGPTWHRGSESQCPCGHRISPPHRSPDRADRSENPPGWTDHTGGGRPSGRRTPKRASPAAPLGTTGDESKRLDVRLRRAKGRLVDTGVEGLGPGLRTGPGPSSFFRRGVTYKAATASKSTLFSLCTCRCVSTSTASSRRYSEA